MKNKTQNQSAIIVMLGYISDKLTHIDDTLESINRLLRGNITAVKIVKNGSKSTTNNKGE